MFDGTQSQSSASIGRKASSNRPCESTSGDLETAWKVYTRRANRVVDLLKSKTYAVRGIILNDKVSTQQSSYSRTNPKMVIHLSSTTIFRTASMLSACETAT